MAATVRGVGIIQNDRTIGLPPVALAYRTSRQIKPKPPVALAYRTSRQIKPSQSTIAELIARGESRSIEFKQTGRFNNYTGEKDPVLEHMVVKSVAGFLNAAGGTLLIGVSDHGEITGIEPDFATLGRKASLDGYELWLTNLLDNRMGPAVVANVVVSFETDGGPTVCRVDVKPAPKPVFVKGTKGESELFVRLNNSTRGLNVPDALDYVKTHWGL